MHLVLFLTASILARAALPPGFEDDAWCPSSDFCLVDTGAPCCGPQHLYVQCQHPTIDPIITLDEVWTGSKVNRKPPAGWVKALRCDSDEFRTRHGDSAPAATSDTEVLMDDPSNGVEVGECEIPALADAAEALLQGRYACKKFDGVPVPAEILRRILRLTQSAPTCFNLQPYVAVVVQNTDALATLANAMSDGNRPKLLSAAGAIVFGADQWPERSFTDATPSYIPGALETFIQQAGGRRAWAYKQTALAAQQFMIAATGFGVNTGPMEGFVSMEAVRDAVTLPERYAVPLVVAFGYAEGDRPKSRGRLPYEEVFFHDSFDASRPLTHKSVPII